ncbi:CusA/CzcA family heavy metal efflux RND transporter [bacterium]|nr:MAG: CusA/CzcA family heavy metal efflux RND transporter [bacterium]
MLELLVRFSLQNRILVLLLLAALIGAGVYALIRMPVDAFPDTTPVQVQVNTVAPSLNPEEVEQQITLPVELSIGGLPGLSNVRSVSKFGLSQLVATFEDGTSISDARQYMAERLSSVSLPAGIERPQLGPIATGLGEVFHYVLRSEEPTRTLEELRTLHDWVVKPELMKVSGVAEVNSWGGHEKQFHVVISPPALLEYNLTLGDVFAALERNNQNVGGGLLTSGGRSQLVHGLGRVTTTDEISDIVIASFDGVPIRIGDIAEDVRIGHEIRRGAVSAGGEGEVVLGLAFMLMGENSKAVTERLKARLDSVRKSLPDDVIVDVVYDRTELTREVIRTVEHNLIAGAVLVVIVLLVLLGNLRAGLLVAVIIPLAMLFAVLGMQRFAIAASLLSLGAIDFGILVDGAVVMTESNTRRLADKARTLGRKLSSEERLEVIQDSARNVSRPIVFGMLIIAVVFVPVLTLEGMEGKMFRPMAMTFIFAIAGALLLALTLSPVLGYYFLPHGYRDSDGRFSRWLVAGYSRMLTTALRFRTVTFAVATIGVLGAGAVATQMGGEFIPRLSEGSIVFNVIRLAGVSLDESVRYNTRIEQHLLQEFPDELRHVWSRIGTAEVATDPMGLELTDIFLSLTPRDQWTKAGSQADLVAAMQEELDDLPGTNIIATQPIELRMNEMISGIRSDLGIKIYGDDFDELVRISDEVQRILLEIPGQSDIAVDQLTGQPTLRIRVDPNALARHGVAAADVLDFVEIIGNRQVGEIFEGQRQFPLAVRLPDRHREDIDVLRSTIIPTETGLRLSLQQLAVVTEEEGISTINREWGRRLIRVQCNVRDRDVASFVAEAQERIDGELELPPGYVIDWGGQFENLGRARLRFMIVVPMTLILVFMLLYLSLQNIRDVLIIYTGIPFAAVGGIVALWLRDIPFSVSASIGFIALAGIAVLNGQILVSAIRNLIRQGRPVEEAVRTAAAQRLRPVLATAITDAVGFIPMAMSIGVGAEVQRPLATVVVAGVLTSTLLTLFVLPLLYLMVSPRDKHTRDA